MRAIQTYHHIIVGAGSAGCVLAERLSSDPSIQVLLLEAGPPDTHPFIHMPKGIGLLSHNPKYIWHFETEAHDGAPAEVWRRGKVLGGSSSVNGMMYFRGHPEDYDGWDRGGARGWGWSHMERAFRAIEDRACREQDGRRIGGTVGLSQSRYSTTLTEAFIGAGVEMGVPRVLDANHPAQEGVAYAPWSIKDGRRSSSALFLRRAAGRPNLTIRTDVLVDRVLFEGRRAVGVAAACHGERVVFRADGEVVLSAGALETPLILQRSGVGDASALKALGIEPLQHSPNVGRHMLEHRLLKMVYEVPRPLSINAEFRAPRVYFNTLRYALTRKGPMATGAYDVCAFVRTRPELDRPDAEILMGPYSHELHRGRLRIGRGHTIHLFGYPLRSCSQGTIEIRSPDPASPPRIVPNYLSNPYDREVTVDMFRMIRRWMGQPSLAPFIRRELRPGPAVESNAEILEAFRRSGSAGFHACGTVRMGDDADAPLDSRLRVKGVANLRVADGSIMPTMVSCNTNGPIMAIGWRAAEIFLEDWRAPHVLRATA